MIQSSENSLISMSNEMPVQHLRGIYGIRDKS